jgi:hypothetical protein
MQGATDRLHCSLSYSYRAKLTTTDDDDTETAGGSGGNGGGGSSVGGEEDLGVQPLGPEQLLHLRRRVERRLQHFRRDRLPHRRPPRQVAEDRAVAHSNDN